MTFKDNQMLLMSFEALNTIIAEFRNDRGQLEDTFKRIGEDILFSRNTDFYIRYLVGGKENFRYIAS